MVTPPEPQTVLITGANRGIGLALTTQYAAAGSRVIATCRSPDTASDLEALAAAHPNLTVEPLDVTDFAGIQSLADRYQDTPIDVLISNAGQYGDLNRQTWGALDHGLFQQLMDVNAYAPLKLVEAFAPQVTASSGKKVAALTSLVGSIASVDKAPRSPFYAASKAALNMIMRGLAMRLRDHGISVAVFMPGLVETRMLRETFGLSQEQAETTENFDYGGYPTISARDSATHLITQIESLTPERSGKFLNYDGTEIPW